MFKLFNLIFFVFILPSWEKIVYLKTKQSKKLIGKKKPQQERNPLSLILFSCVAILATREHY